MSRPDKFDIMRRQRRVLNTHRLREEARELGYDEDEEHAEVRERQALMREATLTRQTNRARRWWWPITWRTT